jgi:hypothetical protein
MGNGPRSYLMALSQVLALLLPTGRPNVNCELKTIIARSTCGHI